MGNLSKTFKTLYRTDKLPDDYDDNWRFQNVKANTVTALFIMQKDLHEALDMLPKEWSINAYDTDIFVWMSILKAILKEQLVNIYIKS